MVATSCQAPKRIAASKSAKSLLPKSVCITEPRNALLLLLVGDVITEERTILKHFNNCVVHVISEVISRSTCRIIRNPLKD